MSKCLDATPAPASYAYLRDGTVDYQAWTNHLWTKYEYDGRGLISSVLHRNTDTSHDLARRDYWRDDRDRILAWKRGSDNFHNGMEDGRGDRYGYDDEGQLTSASYRAATPETSPSGALRADSFSYDKLGNPKGSNYVASRAAMNFTRKNNGLNQYSGWWPYSSTSYEDDVGGDWGAPGAANGVLMMDGWITASYNALNQPVAMWSRMYPGGPSAQYLWFGYDPLGRCVKRWMGTGDQTPVGPNPTTYYYYDGWNLIQEGLSAGTASRVYVHGGRMDEIVASQAGGVWSYHQYDAQGNCIMLTDTNGLIREQYDYDAFGMPYVYNAAGDRVGGAAQWGNRFLFTGREWLKDLKVYDYRNRMYQPELGRFLQPDPKQFAAGDYNLYRYCHNDPVNRSDPTGLQETQDGEPKCLNPFTSTGGGDWNWGNGAIAAAMVQAQRAGADQSAPKPIEMAGHLAVDTDGAGARQGDPKRQSNIPAGVDANGNIVPRYLDNGKGAVNPAMVRPLNADTDSFAVAPKQYAPANEGAKTGGVIIAPGARATATLPDGRVMESKVGDYGPEHKVGEFSPKAFRDHGIPLINVKGIGPMPSLDGVSTPNIPVIMRYYP